MHMQNITQARTYTHESNFRSLNQPAIQPTSQPDKQINNETHKHQTTKHQAPNTKQASTQTTNNANIQHTQPQKHAYPYTGACEHTTTHTDRKEDHGSSDSAHSVARAPRERMYCTKRDVKLVTLETTTDKHTVKAQWQNKHALQSFVFKWPCH